MECEFPTVNSSSDDIKHIFKTVKTIAVIGLSPDPSKDSNHVAAYLQKAGYTIIPIYPKNEMILGEQAYASLADVPASIQIDMVDIFRKPEVLDAIADACIARGGSESPRPVGHGHVVLRVQGVIALLPRVDDDVRLRLSVSDDI